jgi:Uma2 family endonuclease
MITMVNLSSAGIPQPGVVSPIPPLENGDRLTRHEFERRYQAMLHIKKAELIEGVVYLASPLRFSSHAEPHSNLVGWLWTYQIATSGVRLGIEPTVLLDQDNEPQPDGVLLIPESAGGQSRLNQDDYIEGAPELVAEVAASSAAKDLHDKKKAYRRNGVKEYIVWQIYKIFPPAPYNASSTRWGDPPTQLVPPHPFSQTTFNCFHNRLRK